MYFTIHIYENCEHCLLLPQIMQLDFQHWEKSEGSTYLECNKRYSPGKTILFIFAFLLLGNNVLVYIFKNPFCVGDLICKHDFSKLLINNKK